MIARGIAAIDITAELKKLGLERVVTVPDTHQRSLHTEIAGDPYFSLTVASTEDEAVGICAGLWWGGVEPLMVIQHAGVFASVNTLRGIGVDMAIPITMLVGLYNRDPSLPPEAASGSMASTNRLLRPLLQTLGIESDLMEGPDDIEAIARSYRRAHEQLRPAVALVGAETL
ncbi:MAG: hypothetical protein GEU28_05100 [Dehalococcoidia bacterium]|nr:hypothetical protein [Dehalococcoidia bacterium]